MGTIVIRKGGKGVKEHLNRYGLYLLETNAAWFCGELGTGQAGLWQERAGRRRELINRFCWNEAKGFYYDYDFAGQRQSPVESAAANFAAAGNLWEKYDALTGGIDVTDEYKMPAMLGWTAGVFLYACELSGVSEDSGTLSTPKTLKRK